MDQFYWFSILFLLKISKVRGVKSENRFCFMKWPFHITSSTLSMVYIREAIEPLWYLTHCFPLRVLVSVKFNMLFIFIETGLVSLDCSLGGPAVPAWR